MRLLTVIAEMGSGGAESIAAQLATGASERGDDVTLATHGGWRLAPLGSSGVDVLPLPRTRGTTGNTLVLGGFNYLHGAVDMVAKFAGFSLLVESLFRAGFDATASGGGQFQSAQYHRGDVGGVSTTEWSRSGAGWLIRGGCMLTQRVELTGRYDRLVALSKTDPALEKMVQEQGQEVGVGINVYLNGHKLKVQADHHYQFGNSPLEAGRHVARVQLDASF